ncbi:right-handed parallel beta-helix repeat-containing protein [Anaeromyxobacter sp. Fw109-5]|uniref:right-handed parallel beta-helix repeat-containing protein n=1 Tax=Anaeromyxobacter sp. (strain Fw109-5) TaxID=404589 RepID=UPI0011809E3B|nr:right-handed parallel beta-helix repeat-containing protein [Anaeromyxobacter sp. Fw109-5]
MDRRCSTRAATCALETIGARTRDCEQGGLVCGDRSGAPSCQCPANEGAEFAVAAPASMSQATLVPTGVAEPPECRFRSLTAAIAAAADAGGGTVIAMGGNTGSSRFGVATGETLPIDIPAGVTVRSDHSTSGVTYAIHLDDAAASAAVRLHGGGALSDFVIENEAGDSTRDAIELACDGTNLPVRLDRVELRGEGVDAEHRLQHGIHVNDTCGITAADVVIAGMEAEAVLVNAAVESAFVGGAFERNGKGVRVKQGVLKLEGVRVEMNAGKGIEADSSSGEAVLELRGVKVLRNGETGIAAMNATRLFIEDSTVFGNGARDWGPPNYPNSTGTVRKCGGIVLIGEPPEADAEPTFRFARNRVYSNSGDQVLVMLSGGLTWPLGAAACGTMATDTTVFGCYDPDASGSSVSYRGLVVIDAVADVSRISWKSGVAYPSGSTDYKWFGTSSLVLLTGTPTYCALPAQLDCSTPDSK